MKSRSGDGVALTANRLAQALDAAKMAALPHTSESVSLAFMLVRSEQMGKR